MDNDKFINIKNIDCSDDINITNILKSIKEINTNQYKIYYHGEIIDYNFEINNIISLEKIELLEKKIKNKLPNDYKEFILNTNGIKISYNARILSIEEIYFLRKTYDSFYPNNFLIIADCANSEVQIAINLNTISDRNIYMIDIINDDYFYALNCDFTTFLNRFILSYGSTYWEWSKIKSNISKIN